MPLFTSFDDAWTWFASGGQLVPLLEQRERLTAGRAQLIAFQAPMQHPAVTAAADDVLDALSGVPGLRAMDHEHLHVSLGMLGFQVIEPRRPDDIRREAVGPAAERAASLLRGVRAIDVRVGPVNVFPDALILEVHDDGTLATLHRRVAEARGVEPASTDESHYLPHVTIAWFEDVAVEPALREHLPALRARPPAAAMVRRIELARWWFTGEDNADVDLDVVRSYRLA